MLTVPYLKNKAVLLILNTHTTVHRPCCVNDQKECSSSYCLPVLRIKGISQCVKVFSDSPLHSLEGPCQVLSSLKILSLACPLQHRCHQREQSGAQWHWGPGGRGVHENRPQIQCQLYCTTTQWCDFVVRTEKDIHIQRIYRNTEWWEQQLPKLKAFYFDTVLPELTCPRYTKGGIREQLIE